MGKDAIVSDGEAIAAADGTVACGAALIDRLTGEGSRGDIAAGISDQNATKSGRPFTALNDAGTDRQLDRARLAAASDARCFHR